MLSLMVKRRFFQTQLARSALAAASLMLAAGTASATPDSHTDPMAHLLAEKGLLGNLADAPAANERPLVQRFRDTTSDLVLTALNFLGVPYRRGGSTADNGFDCSGFTRHIFETSQGLQLPRRVDDQARAAGLVAVKRSELRPGDLVFFNTLKRTFSHVGIYVGEGKFIHAPKPGGEVRVEDMRFAYWTKRYTGARRSEPSVAALASPAEHSPAAATLAVQ